MEVQNGDIIPLEKTVTLTNEGDAVYIETPLGKTMTVSLKGGALTLYCTGDLHLESEGSLNLIGRRGVKIEGLTTTMESQLSTTVKTNGVMDLTGALIKIN